MILANGVPVELAAGACIEVWIGADEEQPDWWEKGALLGSRSPHGVGSATRGERGATSTA